MKFKTPRARLFGIIMDIITQNIFMLLVNDLNADTEDMPSINAHIFFGMQTSI